MAAGAAPHNEGLPIVSIDLLGSYQGGPPGNLLTSSIGTVGTLMGTHRDTTKRERGPSFATRSIRRQTSADGSDLGPPPPGAQAGREQNASDLSRANWM